MPLLSRTAQIATSAERVFKYVDDIRNLARHMSERRSMPMMGSRLKLEILTPNATGIGATYRYSGKMMGLVIDFSETVTRYVVGREKVWRTIGSPQLLIIEQYEMAIIVAPLSETSSQLTISFDYELPRCGMWRLVGHVLASSYTRWCLDSMIQGSKRDLEAGVA